MDECKQQELKALKLHQEVIGLSIQNHQLSIAVLNYKWQEVKAQIEALEESATTPVGNEDA